MFDRIAYKRNARDVLAKHWTGPVLVTLVTAVFVFLLVLPDYLYTNIGYNNFFNLVSLLLSLSVCGILWFASAVFFLSFTNDNTISLSCFFDAVNRWITGAAALLWTSLWCFLWFLLFIIPGIVKAVSYSQIFFILAEYPGLSVRKALKISKTMTKGFKGDLFTMYLSFAGWMLLCIFSFGIGFIWLIPYMMASFSYAYRYLKTNAISIGILVESDFSEIQ